MTIGNLCAIIICIIHILLLQIGSKRMTTTDIIIHLYDTVLSSLSAQAIKQTEQELLSIESSPFFVYANMALLFSESSSFALKQYAATYLKGFIDRLVMKDKYYASGQPSLEACSENLEKFIVMIRSPLLQLDVKRMLKAPISELTHFLINKGGQKATMNQKFFKLILDAQRNQDGDVDFAFIAIYAQAYIDKESSKNIEELLQQVFPLVCKIALKVQQFALIRHPALRKQLSNISEILKEYSQLISHYSRSFFNLKVSALVKFDFSILQRLLVSALQFASPANVSGSFLYTYLPNDKKTSQNINIYKGNYLSVFSSALKTILSHKTILSPVFQAIDQLVTQIFGSTAELLKYQRYFQLKQTYMLSYLLNKALNFLYWCYKHQQYKQDGIFFKISGQLVERVLIRCLDFSPNDQAQLHEQDNEKFVSNLQSIISLNVYQDYLWKDYPSEDYSHLRIKSTSAAMLSLLCQMDRQLLKYHLNIASKIIKKKLCKNIPKMLLILCIIGPLCKQEPFFSQLVVIFKQYTLELKVFSSCDNENLQFALLINCISHLDFVFYDIEADKNNLVNIGKRILLSPYCKTTSMRMLSNSIFESIARQFNQCTDFNLSMLKIYNSIISLADGCLVFLLEEYQSIFYSMNSCPQFFREGIDEFMQSKQIHKTIKLIGEIIVKELQKQCPKEIVVQLGCKIYKNIKDVEGMSVEILDLIQETFQTLLTTEYSATNIGLQRKLYSITISMIKQNQKINKAQLGIIETIPMFFYNKNKCRFDGILEIVLLFLDYYQKYSDLVYDLLKMAFDEMTMMSTGLGEIYYGFDGVLVLQSIATQKTKQLKKEHWQSIKQTTLKILEGICPNNKIYFTNLIALLALSLAFSCKNCPDDENQALITRIISALPSFDLDGHASKVMILALSELLIIPQQKFVGARFNVIFEAFVDMFQQNSIFRLNVHQPKIKYFENLKFFNGPVYNVAYSRFFVKKFNKAKLLKRPIFQKTFAGLTKEKQIVFNEQILDKKCSGSNKNSSKFY